MTIDLQGRDFLSTIDWDKSELDQDRHSSGGTGKNERDRNGGCRDIRCRCWQPEGLGNSKAIHGRQNGVRRLLISTLCRCNSPSGGVTLSWQNTVYTVSRNKPETEKLVKALGNSESLN